MAAFASVREAVINAGMWDRDFSVENLGDFNRQP